MTNYLFIIYLISINIITFAIYGWDKRQAKKRAWRTSENTLIGLAVIGGSIGAIGGMYCFHHKTKHIKFKIGLPVIFLIQCVLLYIICRK